MTEKEKIFKIICEAIAMDFYKDFITISDIVNRIVISKKKVEMIFNELIADGYLAIYQLTGEYQLTEKGYISDTYKMAEIIVNNKCKQSAMG